MNPLRPGLWLRLLVSAALIALLLWRVDEEQALQTFRDADYAYLALALPVYSLSKLVDAYRWRLMLRRVGRPPLGGLFGTYLLANMANNFFPVRVGDILRVQVPARRYGLARAGLTATVFDLPQALEVGRETIAAEGMGDRVSIREGDFWRDGLGAGYDVALLFNIIHAHSPDRNADLLSRVSGAVNPGGLIAVLDQLPGRVSGQAAKALARLQGLNYFNDLDARTYDFDQIAGWMAKAGIGRPRRILLRRMPGFGVVLGIRTAAGLANTWGGGP